MSRKTIIILEAGTTAGTMGNILIGIMVTVTTTIRTTIDITGTSSGSIASAKPYKEAFFPHFAFDPVKHILKNADKMVIAQ